jgi:hypothetical protein
VGAVGRPLAVALLGLALLPLLAPAPASGQVPDPGTVGDLVRPVADPVVARLIAAAENATLQDLHREEVSVDMALDVRNVDYQIVSLIFGGGKVGADVEATLHLEFRAVSASRLDDALRSTGTNTTLNGTFGVPTSRAVLTAEEIRLVGAGALLDAFEGYEAEAARRYLEATVPGLVVQSTTFAWSNTEPGSHARGLRPPDPSALDPGDPRSFLRQFPLPDLREPPLVLDAKVRLQYLDRVSALQLIDLALRNRTGDPASELKREIQRQQGEAFLERNAFNLAGFSQLLDFAVPPGWRLNVTMTVPRGFTIEGATSELQTAPDHRSMSYVLDGSARERRAQQAAVVTVSDRFLVTATILATVTLLGYALRLPIEAAVLGGWHLRHRRRQSRAKV